MMANLELDVLVYFFNEETYTLSQFWECLGLLFCIKLFPGFLLPAVFLILGGRVCFHQPSLTLGDVW